MMMKKLIVPFALALSFGLAACKEPSVIDEIEKQEAEQTAQAEKALAEAQDYLKKNGEKQGVVTTKSGLQYEIVRKADASQPSPGPRDAVAVHYEGRLTNGTVFDSSYARNEPATLMLTEVIPGWTEALQLMKPGDEYRLTVSPLLGYGARGSAPRIPPNAVLIFKIELLAFQRASDGAVFREGAAGKAPPAPAAAAAPAPPKPAPRPAAPPRPKPPEESDANVRFE